MACSDQITSEALENMALDAITAAELANSRAGGVPSGGLIGSSVSRLGDSFSTLRGQLAKLGYMVPIAYTSGIVFTVDDGAKTVEESGKAYAPKISALPFTTSGTFVGDDDDRFRLAFDNELQTQVTQNESDIAQNSAAIAQNESDIAQNSSAIAQNESDIADLASEVGINLQTVVATTSGTSIDFTGIPAGVNRVTVALENQSFDANVSLWVQLGDSGGVETTLYEVVAAVLNASPTASAFTAAFQFTGDANAAIQRGGAITFVRLSGNTWCGDSSLASDSATTAIFKTTGTKTLSGELTTVRLTSSTGAANFDNGNASISWEF